MRKQNRAFYRDKKEILVGFSAGEISSDGSVVLLDKIERDHRLIHYFSKFLPDHRDPKRIDHSIYKLLKQRVYMMMHGYEDTNDVESLKNDPLFEDILEGSLASQPTLSRLENSLTRADIFNLSNAWIDQYVRSLEGRKEIIIDVDSTDDPTHGAQQLSMFHGYHGQFMYDQLFFHDGITGQIILPVLRPGNSHSNRWFVSILKRIIQKIKAKYPNIKIYIRGDSGFNSAPFYDLANEYKLKFAIGIASNSVLKRKVERARKAVYFLYGKHGVKHQHFMSFAYQAKSWTYEQQCYAKVESTGKGMNTRFVISNMDEKTAREIYFGFYVKRGDTSENRIKEVKNMCFSDRLSCHGFWANSFRLFLSALVYEMFLLLKTRIRKTSIQEAWRWQIDKIRLSLLKVGAILRKTKRRIYYQLSSAFAHQELFMAILLS